VSKSNRLSLTLVGATAGAAMNTLVSYPYLVLSNFFFGLFAAAQIVAAAIIFYWSFPSSDLERSRKLQFIFLGAALVSFLYAVAGVVQFWVGSPYIGLSNDPPYLWLGGMPFPAFLGSFLLGGLFSLAERFIEISAQKAA